MAQLLTEAPGSPGRTFLDFPFVADLDTLNAEIAVLGIPYGLPYSPAEMANEQSCAPNALRVASGNVKFIRERFDWDFGGSLLGKRDTRLVDCGNVTADPHDHQEHYRRAEAAVRKIFDAEATLIALGGDHGISVPVLRALETIGQEITLVHVDAHLDWRDQSNGVREGYRSPLRRASEMEWIGAIVQIGIRGNGSLEEAEVREACAKADVITAYEMHDVGMDAVLQRIPDGGPYYLTIDADGLDPTIMPAVMSPTPGGLNWVQIHKLIQGLVRKGPVLGMDLVEIAPARDVGRLTLIHAERLICNFIGSCVQAGYFD